eukprot:Gb_38619 [translate_table: standard]
MYSKQNERPGDSNLIEWEDPPLSPHFYPSYYVQSPSNEGEKKPLRSTPLALSPIESAYYSPFIRPSQCHTRSQENAYAVPMNPWGSRNSLQSSRNSAVQDKMTYTQWVPGEPINEEEEEEEYLAAEIQSNNLFQVPVRSGLRRQHYQSNHCICLQRISFQEFRVAEGSDKSGVPTKVFSCNCNVTFDLDNRSEFFGVHLRPAHITMTFADLTVATGHGRQLYVDRDSTMTFNVNIAAKKKAVYGAGPSMAHLLQSGEGLPLIMHIGVESSIRVVWDIVKPKYYHHALCRIIVDGKNAGHHISLANTSCAYNAS